MLGAKNLPQVKIQNNLGSKWLGRTLWYCSGNWTTTMVLQKSILSDPKTLERIIAHEMVHHVDVITLSEDELRHRCRSRKNIMAASHAERFLALAQVINDHVGEDLVTVTSDERYVVEATKEFLVMIVPTGDGRHAFAWGVRMTPTLAKLVERYWDRGGRVSKTTDLRWTRGVKIGKGFGIPLQKEDLDALKQLYGNYFWGAPS